MLVASLLKLYMYSCGGEEINQGRGGLSGAFETGLGRDDLPESGTWIVSSYQSQQQDLFHI